MGKADNLDNKINVDSIPEERFSLKAFVEDVAQDFNREGFLVEGKFSRGNSEGIFESALWILEVENNKTYTYVDFRELHQLEHKNIKQQDILLIKCWLAEFLLSGYKPSGIREYYRNILKLLDVTKNFSEIFLQENKGNSMEFLRYGDGIAYDEATVRKIVTCVKSYIYYREDIGSKINPDTISKYLDGLESLENNLKKGDNIRDLPSNKDALMLGYYIDTFFNDASILQELKLFYMPIMIWWKVGNVIPIRPVEITTKMVRDCLVKEGDRLYLKVNRAKNSEIVRKAPKRVRLPVLKKLEITKDIYDLIESYKMTSNRYGYSKTLFSYIAMYELRKYLINLDDEKYSFLGLKIMFVESAKNTKYDIEYFTISSLANLLRSFYKNIIKGYYKDSLIENCVNLNDVRHFAFTSLMLQGLSLVEIALIGGHKNSYSQYSYQSNVSYYVDSEIVKFINAKQSAVDFSNKSIKEIIFSKTILCDKPLRECRKTEDDIGYCTADMSSESLLCENDEFCFKCKKWWCSPTEDNYDRLRKYIQEECITTREKKIAIEEEYLQNVISMMNPVNLDNNLRANADEEREFKTLSMNIRRDAHTLLDLKKILLDLVPKKKLKR
jgi:hypothetical protein